MKKTLLDKIWGNHTIPIPNKQNDLDLLYIDLHLVHEVTSPQAFEEIRLQNLQVRQPSKTFATMDHNVPTKNQDKPIKDAIAAKQIQTLKNNCKQFGIRLFDMNTQEQGIVHVIGPELGLTQPGKTIVCGDSHTATHGAFGALAFGIGTSEVKHVLATQCLWQKKPKSMLVNFNGQINKGVYSKDLILSLIRKIGTAGATGYVIEYAGEAISNMSVEARMTICNMSIEAGARAGMISPDQKTLEYIYGKPYAPKPEEWESCKQEWLQLKTDNGASFDKIIDIDCSKIEPQVSWGTSPEMVAGITENVPNPNVIDDISKQKSYTKALEYMNIPPETPIAKLPIDKVFIGSCTNSRIEDLRESASIIQGQKKSSKIKMVYVVPGSQKVKQQAEAEGLDTIFKQAGFDWREPGCSMCLAMNEDVLDPGEYCASTSNRNFEGRQGKGGRTFLVSPVMATLAAIHGSFVDSREVVQ